MDTLYMVYKEAASYLRMDQRSLRKYVKSGEIACHRLPKAILFKKEDLDVFMDSKRMERNG